MASVSVKDLRLGPTESLICEVRGEPGGRGRVTFTVGEEKSRTQAVTLTPEWQTVGSHHESSGPTVVGVRVEMEGAAPARDTRLLSL